MSLSRQDVVLGRALLAWGLVDRQALLECAEDVRRCAAQGRPVTLGQVLVGRRVLSVERYQAIVARLRQAYLGAPGAGPQVQQATAQMPLMSESGRYTGQVDAPRVDESAVDRAVSGWKQVAPQVAAPGAELEFDFSPPTPAAAPAARPPTARPAARPAPASPGPAPRPAPGPAAAAPGADAGPDAVVRKRLKVPPGAERFDVGEWTVEGFLGDGAFGVVYRVVRRGAGGPPFALKMLKHVEPSPALRQRFIQEARTMAKLRHPGIVHVHDAGVANGLLWFVMDFQPGRTLQKKLDEDGALPYADGLRVVRRLCEAVAYAHSHGILHRDLKPENIIMVDDREPVLMDFGLAKDSASNLNLTMEGQRIGTPLYMAPELLLDGGKATPPTEVYALGAILYQVLTGKPPYVSKSIVDLAGLIDKGAFTPLRERCKEAPKALERLVASALAGDPTKRPQTVAELLAGLPEA